MNLHRMFWPLVVGNAASLLPRLLLIVAIGAGVVLVRLTRPTPEPSIVVPIGFQDELVREVGDIATGIGLLPDGRMLISTRDGRVWLHKNPEEAATLALDLWTPGMVCNDDERGMSTLTVDPEFAQNRHVYVFYAARNGTPLDATCPIYEDTVVRNKVVRYTLGSDDTLTQPEVIVDNIPSPCGDHNGGDVKFGPLDGLMYISVGDGGQQCGTSSIRARYPSTLSGKILRIHKDGSIPSDNPYANVPGAVMCSQMPPQTLNLSKPCKEIFAFGLRNPFRIAFKPGTNEFLINDVGWNTWEEISVGGKGLDYGWPCYEGPRVHLSEMDECPPDSVISDTKPIHAYLHSVGRGAVTGGVFVIGSNWPAPYEGSYFFGDTCCGNVFRLVQDGGVYTDTIFTKRPGYLIDMEFDARTSTLYYTTGGEGAVRAIRYVGTGQ
jgi:glucose/arabinose dehydrogenase